MAARQEKDTSFRVGTATVNMAVWERFAFLHDKLNEADTVYGVLFVRRIYEISKGRRAGQNEEGENHMFLRQQWRKICVARGRPVLIAEQSWNGGLMCMSVPKQHRCKQILSWLSLATNAAGVKVDGRPSILAVQAAPDNPMWGGFKLLLRTSEPVREQLKLPPATALPAHLRAA